MSNILTFPSTSAPSPAANLIALLKGVAQHRHAVDDVFWLKENAELLGVLAATQHPCGAAALASFEEFYQQIEEKFQFFPQYYRFFLSICLDLEDLGLEGNKGQALAERAASAGLVEAELSDLQRAEARRLLARRGAAAPLLMEDALDARLRAFATREATFALPNKKAAYELTHIVFYLSEYGQRDPQMSAQACVSLAYAGLLAYLDQDHDLLAEVCTALRFAGTTPSEIWTEEVSRAHAAYRPVAQPPVAPLVDGFHAYLVTGWAETVRGARGFEAPIPAGKLYFVTDAARAGALRPLSECLFDLGARRTADWAGMRGRVMATLSAQTCTILEKAEASTDHFDGFFERFARAAPQTGLRAG